MKSFKKFIEEQNIMKLNIKSKMLFDEYFVSEEYDRLNENSVNLHLNESNARYNGQFELAEFLTFEILKRHSNNCSIEFDKEALKKFDNIFFNKIIVNYTTKNIQNSGGYKPKNKETLSLKEVIINVNSKDNVEYENIFSTISHELKHAWQDYKNIYKDTFLSDVLEDEVYKNTKKYLNDKNFTKSFVSRIINKSFKIESDAYASEFSTDFQIEIYKKNPQLLQDCLDLARSSDVYSEIYDSYFICSYIDKHGEIHLKDYDITKQDILDISYEIDNKTKTWDKFQKKYLNKLRKQFGKLCNITANVFYKYIDEMEENKIDEGLIVRPSRKFSIKIQRLIKISKN